MGRCVRVRGSVAREHATVVTGREPKHVGGWIEHRVLAVEQGSDRRWRNGERKTAGASGIKYQGAGRREVGVVALLIKKRKIRVKTVEWEDVR